MTSIRLAQSDADIARCWPVMRELRGHLAGETAFLAQVKRQMAEGGYRLAMVESAGEVVAVAGYRVSEWLVRGRTLYVDDMVTAERHRSRGHGARLLDWLEGQARAAGCRELHLDSGVERADAHRFYLRQGLEIAAHHFVKRLG